VDSANTNVEIIYATSKARPRPPRGLPAFSVRRGPGRNLDGLRPRPTGSRFFLFCAPVLGNFDRLTRPETRRVS